MKQLAILSCWRDGSKLHRAKLHPVLFAVAPGIHPLVSAFLVLPIWTRSHNSFIFGSDLLYCLLYYATSRLLWWSGPWDSTRMLEQTDETTFLIPAETSFSKDMKRRQTCTSTLSFLKVNLLFSQRTFFPSLIYMAFWTIKHESSQSLTFFLPLNIKSVFLYIFFQSAVYNSCCFPENPMGSLQYYVQ